MAAVIERLTTAMTTVVVRPPLILPIPTIPFPVTFLTTEILSRFIIASSTMIKAGVAFRPTPLLFFKKSCQCLIDTIRPSPPGSKRIATVAVVI